MAPASAVRPWALFMPDTQRQAHVVKEQWLKEQWLVAGGKTKDRNSHS